MYGAVQTVFRHAPVDTAAAECLPAPALMHELFRGHAVVVDRVLGALAKKTRLPDGTPERDQVGICMSFFVIIFSFFSRACVVAFLVDLCTSITAVY